MPPECLVDLGRMLSPGLVHLGCVRAACLFHLRRVLPLGGFHVVDMELARLFAKDE